MQEQNKKSVTNKAIGFYLAVFASFRTSSGFVSEHGEIQTTINDKRRMRSQ